MYCYVRDCPNGLRSFKKKKDSDSTKFFPVPEDKNILEKWKRVTPKGENELSSKDKLCDNHFLPSEVLWFTETKLPNGNVRRLLRDEPILRPGTIPSIFPAERLDKEKTTMSGKDRQETPKLNFKNIPSGKDRLATPKSIVKNTNQIVKENVVTSKSNFRIRFKDPAESSGKRNPQRVKRRSTILDDYWTDEELSQVHNSGGGSRAGSAKKRKTESTGLQPVIRLVPLECLMDKTVSKSKTTCKPVAGNRPSTEEIDHELKKVIEIPLLTQLRPKKSLTVRSTKETVQFKHPKKNVSRSRMKMVVSSEALSLHDGVTANSSEGFNEIKIETPDIEEELARMEMDEENEDVKSSDIVVTNQDDGYSINECMDSCTLITPEGDEIPTIKSESEEEQAAFEVDSSSTCDNDIAVDKQMIHAAESELSAGSEQGSALPPENSDNTLAVHEQPEEVPGVPAEVEQNKDNEEKRNNLVDAIEKSSSIAAEDTTICEKVTKEGKETKTAEEKGRVEGVLEDQEKEETTVPSKEGETADFMIEAAQKEVITEDQDLLTAEKIQKKANDNEETQDVEAEKADESAMATESLQEVESKRKRKESAKEIEKETLLDEIIEKVVENEEMPKPIENQETSKSLENQEIPYPVESEPPQAAEGDMNETNEDGKGNEASMVSEEPITETVNVSEEPSRVEKNLGEDTEIRNKDELRSNNDNHDIPEVDGKINETDKGETESVNDELSKPDDSVIDVNDEPSNPDDSVIDVNDEPSNPDDSIIDVNNEPSKPEDSVIDVSDSEVEADKGLTGEMNREADTIIDLDLFVADQPPNNKDTPMEQSSEAEEAEPEKKDDENAMEIECGDVPANENRVEGTVDDDTHLVASSVADDKVAEAEKDSESVSGENKESKQMRHSENDEEMDIEAEVARLVSEVDETVEASPSKKAETECREGNASNSQKKEKQDDKGSISKETSQPQEIVLQDTTNLGGITAAGVQNLFSQETIQEILKQIKLPLTTPVTFRIAPVTNTPVRSSSGRGRGRKRGGMRGTNRQVVPRASSSSDNSHNSIDLFRHLTRTRTVFDFPTFIPDIDDDIQYWKLCQILKESFHELIETRNTKTSIGKLTLRVAINRPKKPKVQQNIVESETDPQ